MPWKLYECAPVQNQDQRGPKPEYLGPIPVLDHIDDVRLSDESKLIICL